MKIKFKKFNNAMKTLLINNVKKNYNPANIINLTVRYSHI